MASSYHLTIKKYLDENNIGCSLPEYIQRGWNRIYTPEEKEFNKRSSIIGPDVQIPNSIVRHRLNTTKMLRKANTETLRKVFELPDELFINLSTEHKLSDTIEEEKLSFDWDDEDDDNKSKRKKSVIHTIINKKREKRRKFDDYKNDYDNNEPLSLDEIIEEIRTNVGKDLKNEDLKLITELMQIINQHKKDQIMNIYDELIDIQLISKFGDVPKLVEALQDIQKAFEQIAMKTNIASIETVIDVLLEKDTTYRIAAEMLNSFNENITKNKQEKLKLYDKFGDISDHDHTVFNILIKDRISRLPAADLTRLVHDIATILNIDVSKINNNRDDHVKFLSEQLNIIFTRAHLDGIKTILHSMKSSVSASLSEFIDRIENSLNIKLTDHDHIIIESYIHDHLTLLNNNELKIVYERLAQQGTLKRFIGSGELNQMITMGLMKKIDTDGLGTVIENMKEAQIDINSTDELIQALTYIDHYIQTQPSVSLEQIQNQLGMAYFIETRNLSEQDIHELSKAANLYSIAHVSLVEDATKDECSTYLEHIKAPFIRKCMQRILNQISQENSIHLDKVSNKFYNQQIIDLLNELIHGSDEFNRNLLFRQIKEQLKKNKELPDKLYRQMLKEKLISIDNKVKIDTDKKKVSILINGINQILFNEEDYIKQEQLVELFDRIDIKLPERIKHWYKTKSNIKSLQSSPSKIKKDLADRKKNVKAQIKVPHLKVKSVIPTTSSKRHTTDTSIDPSLKALKERIIRKTTDHLATISTVTSSKRNSERKASLVKSRSKTQSIVEQEKKHSKIPGDTEKNSDASADNGENKKTKTSSQISLASKSEKQQKQMLVADHNQPITSDSTTITTDAFSINNTSSLQVENDFIEHTQLSMASSEITKVDSLILNREKSQEKDNQQLFDHQPSTIEHTVTELQDTSTAVTISDSIQLDIKTEAKMKFDLLQKQDDLTEKYFEKNDQSSALTRIEMLQTDLENIQLETTINGQMGENNTFNFELDQVAAPLFSHPLLPSDPKREINTIVNGQTAKFTNDPQYEKTKAQRILAKTILTNTGHQYIERNTIGTISSSSTLTTINTETTSAPMETRQLSASPAKISRRPLNKSLKQTTDIYINSLTKALHNLFTRSEYDHIKLKKIHEELISSGHISPLNEFYLSTNEAIRVILDHCITYNDLIKWTLSLLQTNNKPNLIDFAHDLYSIAIDLDLTLIKRIDNTRCAIEIQENLKHELQTLTETDLREINSYLNAAQLEKLVNLSKKLNVTSKERMILDLNSLLLHLIQVCYTFELKYLPMQTHIREIAETFKSRAVAELARKIDEIEKYLAKNFSITFFGISKRMNESRFILIK